MKKKLNLFLAFALLINLSFIRTGMEFLHDEHCHENQEISHDHCTVLEEAHEDCFICSLDLYQESFYEEISQFVFAQNQFVVNSFDKTSSVLFLSIPKRGRAPPQV